jgi:hypothetical protein
MADKPQNFDELSELLSAFLDGELSESDSARIEAELFQNPQFRQLHDELRGVLLPRYTAPGELAASVMNRIETATVGDAASMATMSPASPMVTKSISNGAAAGWLAWGPMLAVAALVLVAVGIFYRPAALDVAQHDAVRENATAVGKHAGDNGVAGKMDTDIPPSDSPVLMKAKSPLEPGEASEDRRSFGKGGAMPAAKSAAIPSKSHKSAKEGESLKRSDRKEFDAINGPMLDNAPSQVARPAAAPVPEAMNQISGQAGFNRLPHEIQRFSQMGVEGQGRFNARSVTRDEWAVQQQVAEVMDDDLDENLLVIACDITPQALEAKTLDRLLSEQQIAVYDVPEVVAAQQTRRTRVGTKPGAAAVPRADESNAKLARDKAEKDQAKLAERTPEFADDGVSAEGAAGAPVSSVAKNGVTDESDLPAADEAVLVEATTEQIAALLDELEQRPKEFSQVEVLTPSVDQVAERKQRQDLQRGRGLTYRQRNLQGADRFAAGRTNAPGQRGAAAESLLENDAAAAQSQAYRIQLAPRDGQSRAQSRYADSPRQAAEQPARVQQLVEPPSPVTAEEAQLAIEENLAAEQAKDGQVADEIAPPSSSRVLLLLRAVPSEPADR